MLRLYMLCGCLLVSAHSQALTVTFDDVPEMPGIREYTESGVTVRGYGDLDAYPTPGTIRLLSSGTWHAYGISVTTGDLFSAESVDIIGRSSGVEYSAVNPETGEEIVGVWPYDDMTIRGYRDGELIAEDSFVMEERLPQGEQTADGYYTYLFGGDYAAIDRLEIGVSDPVGNQTGGIVAAATAELAAAYPGYEIMVGSCPSSIECAGARLDNLQLTPVPLPGGLVLFGSALGLLGAGRFVQRRVRSQNYP